MACFIIYNAWGPIPTRQARSSLRLGLERRLSASDEGCLSRFHNFFRAETPRADADPLHAAVNRRPDGLKVRLEPPRAHVVRMADLPTYNRSLAANLATLGHQGTFN
jgi:hypothetical protein